MPERADVRCRFRGFERHIPDHGAFGRAEPETRNPEPATVFHSGMFMISWYAETSRLRT